MPSQENLREAAHVIAQSRLPLIFAGGGVALSGAEQALLALVETTNIPVITSAGGKGAIPDRHPLSYGACLSPAGERPEMNQLFDVMQSADVVIGIGTRFSLGNPAYEASTVVNINIDDSEITRVQSNTLPLHGDARATIEALLPFLIEAGAGRRSSPAEAVSASRRLIAYHDISLKEPQYPILDAMRNSIPEDTFIVWDSYAVRLLRPHPLPGESSQDLHRFRLLVQCWLFLSGSAGGESGKTRSPRGKCHRRRWVHVQLLRTFHGGQDTGSIQRPSSSETTPTATSTVTWTSSLTDHTKPICLTLTSSNSPSRSVRSASGRTTPCS